jgi:hypothetical protein
MKKIYAITCQVGGWAAFWRKADDRQNCLIIVHAKNKVEAKRLCKEELCRYYAEDNSDTSSLEIDIRHVEELRLQDGPCIFWPDEIEDY